YQAPAWIEKVKNKKGEVSGFRVNEERAAIVRRIFDLARDGNGATVISQILAREGISLWSQNKNPIRPVDALLRQRTVLGEFAPAMRGENGEVIPDGDPIPGYYPAIVDTKLFDEVQAIIARRTCQKGIPEKVNNLFSQAFRCYKCGGIVRISSGSGKTNLYSRCNKRGAGTCDGEPTHYTLFERALLYHISGLNVASILTGDATDKAQELSLAIDTLTGKRVKLTSKIEALQELEIEAKMEENTAARKRYSESIAKHEVQVSELTARISVLRMELAAVQHTDTTQELKSAQDLIEYLQTAPQDEEYWAAKRRLKQAIGGLVELVICYPHRKLYAHKGGKTLCFFIRFRTGVEYAVAADIDNPRYAVRLETEQPQTDEERKLLMGVMKIFDPRDLYKDLYGPDTAPKEILSVQKADFQRYILDYLGVPRPEK
ncbi:MAG TPA: recombinase family protein, partial [Candidatus Sumerlaeota bacterium]|nr:recombinase family protein [Candidatus Sumerlaeota bacterium]